MNHLSMYFKSRFLAHAMISALTVILIVLISVNFSIAQKVKFKVIDVATGLPIEDVKVRSFPERLFVTYGNSEGDFSVTILKDDTIEITKDPSYKALLLRIKAQNFDSSYTVVVGMVPDSKRNNKDVALKNYQNFEYRFVHDTIAQHRGFKINPLEQVPAIRPIEIAHDDPAFRILTIEIPWSSDKKVNDPSFGSAK